MFVLLLDVIRPRSLRRQGGLCWFFWLICQWYKTDVSDNASTHPPASADFEQKEAARFEDNKTGGLYDTHRTPEAVGIEITAPGSFRFLLKHGRPTRFRWWPCGRQSALRLCAHGGEPL